MRPHRRQEHHRLAPPDFIAQAFFQPPRPGPAEPPRSRRGSATRLSSVRARVVLPHVQVVGRGLVHPVVRHRDGRGGRARAQQERRSPRSPRNRSGTSSPSTPRPAQSPGSWPWPFRGSRGPRRPAPPQTAASRKPWSGIASVAAEPQPEANGVLALLHRARDPAPGAAHRTTCRRRAPDRQVHRRRARQVQALFQQFLHRRGRALRCRRLDPGRAAKRLEGATRIRHGRCRRRARRRLAPSATRDQHRQQ